MANVPFQSGKDARMRLFIGKNEVLLNTKSWNVDMDVTEATDDVGGEDRSRLISFVNFFVFTATVYNDKYGIIDSWLDYYANTDAQVAPLVVTAGLNFKILDRTKKAYAASEATLGKASLAMGDRKERIMTNIGFRARYFQRVPTF